MDKDEIKEMIREWIDIEEQITEINKQLYLLETRQSELDNLLYQNRSKSFIEGVTYCLADLMEEYSDFPDCNAFDMLKCQVEGWYQAYDDFVNERLKNSSPEEREMYKEVITQ